MTTTFHHSLLRLPARFFQLLGVSIVLFASAGAARAETFVIADGDVAALIAALDEAQSGDVIELAEDGVYTLTEPNNVTSGSNGLPVIRNEIAIHGNGSTIQRDLGAPNFRIFYFEGAGPGTTVSDLNIKHGSTLSPGGGSGGGMYFFNSSPTITNCTFSMNRAETTGGGIVTVFNSSPTISNCLFEANFAGARGGGMANLTETNPEIMNTVFRNNIANGEGGGIYNLQSDSSATDCTFQDNIALEGGGMFNDTSSPSVVNCIFGGNWADFGAGMNNIDGSNPTISGCTFRRNSAWWGGGMFNDASSPEILTTLFIDNEARDNDIDDGGGGGMANSNNSNPVIAECTFRGNEAVVGIGGGMFNQNSSPTISSCVFDRNFADPNGGGIYNTNSQPSITDSVFDTNAASNSGGAIYNINSTPTLTHLTFTANGVNDEGGAIFNSQSHPGIIDCVFEENTADYGGAVANLNNSDPTIENSRFSDNSSTWDGGGVYNENSDPTITDCLFNNNEALLGHGGGLANIDGSHSVVTGSDFEQNVATSGGGIFSDAVSSSDVGSCSFCENEPDAIAGPWNDLGGNEFNANCSGPADGTYEQWVQDHFDPSDWENEAITGPSANPAGDGVANLVKYALGFDPLETVPNALPLPEIQTLPSKDDQQFLTLSFTHPTGLTDVEYELELSSNLVDWSESAVLIESAANGETTQRTYRDSVPLESTDRRFMRLRVNMLSP